MASIHTVAFEIHVQRLTVVWTEFPFLENWLAEQMWQCFMITYCCTSDTTKFFS